MNHSLTRAGVLTGTYASAIAPIRKCAGEDINMGHIFIWAPATKKMVT